MVLYNIFLQLLTNDHVRKEKIKLYPYLFLPNHMFNYMEKTIILNSMTYVPFNTILKYTIIN
jgi:hypothetical protein